MHTYDQAMAHINVMMAKTKQLRVGNYIMLGRTLSIASPHNINLLGTNLVGKYSSYFHSLVYVRT